MSQETPARIDPCLFEAYPAALSDVVAELVRAATRLGARLHPTSAASLAELVRVMNCYYSNLIEGHNTRPRDIERSLSDELDSDGELSTLESPYRPWPDSAWAGESAGGPSCLSRSGCTRAPPTAR